MQQIIQGNDTTVSVILYQQTLHLSGEPGDIQVESNKVDLSQVRELSVRLIPYMRWQELTPDFEARGNVIEVSFPASQQRAGKWDVEISYLAPAPGGSYKQVRVRQAFAEVLPANTPASTLSAYVISAEVTQALRGEAGQDAYHYALANGLVTSHEEWMDKLRGKRGYSSYELAQQLGYQGSLEEWMRSLKGRDGEDAYNLAKRGGYQGSLEDWLKSLKGEPGDAGLDAYTLAKRGGYQGSLEEWLLSLKGDEGKSAYQIYLDTTADNPKLTKEQWSNVNDYHYSIIHRYLYGKDAPMTQNKLMGDELVALHQCIKDTADALASVGVKVSEADGIASFPQKIRDYIPPTLLIFRSQQFTGYKQAWYPLLRVDPNYTTPDLSYLFNNNADLIKMPEVEGIERATSLVSMCAGCSSMAGEVKLPDLPRCTVANNMFASCSQLTKVTIGDMPSVDDVGSLLANCSNVTELTIGSLPKLKKSFAMCLYCSSLRSVRFSSGTFACPGDMSHMFSGCALLQRIDGVLEISSVSNVASTFAGCVELSDVKIKGLSNSIDLNNCRELSAESLRYLVDNAQQVTGKTITLSSRLKERSDLQETLEYVGTKAVDKGFSVVYR